MTRSQAKRHRPLGADTEGADIVVTSYALLRIDQAAYAEQTWSGLILDEAQFVKNHRAKTYQAARAVPARTKLAITGTPVENSLMDLWSMLSLTAPGLFPSAERFTDYYLRPIERDGDGLRLAQLRRRIAPLVLRRTKDLVAGELPPKQEQVLEVALQPKHARIYQTHLQRERQKVLGLIDDLDDNRFTILQSLTLLRQLALDPALVDAQHEGVAASKTETLVEMLSEVAQEGHRALVFSQFTSYLRRVQERLSAAGLSTAYLDGSTTDRQQVIDGFRRGDASVFLISLRAGGFGLNLTEADYCFVLDPWWNPGGRAAGRRPRPSDRPDPAGDGLSAGGEGHDRAEGDGAERAQECPVRRRARRRVAVLDHLRRRRDPRAAGTGESQCRGPAAAVSG